MSLTALPTDVLNHICGHLDDNDTIGVARSSLGCAKFVLHASAVMGWKLRPLSYWVRSELCSRTRLAVGIGVESDRRLMVGRVRNKCQSCGVNTRRRVNSVILCEACTNNPLKRCAFMLPADRVARVLFKVYELNNIVVTSSRVHDMIATGLTHHSSRQGKVVFVYEACELAGACRELFRWVHSTLPAN